MEIGALGRILIVMGLGILALGVVFLLVGRIPFFGRLPGDILLRRDGITIFIPIVTMLLVSLVLTVVLNVVLRLFR